MHKPRYERREIRPAFPEAVRVRNIPNWQMARVADIRHNQVLSALLHARVVPATPLVISRLEQIAKLIGYPVDQIFVDGEFRG